MFNTNMMEQNIFSSVNRISKCSIYGENMHIENKRFKYFLFWWKYVGGIFAHNYFSVQKLKYICSFVRIYYEFSSRTFSPEYRCGILGIGLCIGFLCKLHIWNLIGACVPTQTNRL